MKSNWFWRARLPLALVAALAVVQCAKQSAAAGYGEPAGMVDGSKDDSGLPAPVAVVAETPQSKALLAAVHAYAAVRKALAADDLAAARAAAPAAAEKMAALAALAGDKGDELRAGAAAAGKVGKSSEIAMARMAFGEWSRTLIAAVAADKGIAAGVVCYQCTMTKTYQKWLQLGDEMGNPYWGAEMLKCGKRVEVLP